MKRGANRVRNERDQIKNIYMQIKNQLKKITQIQSTTQKKTKKLKYKIIHFSQRDESIVKDFFLKNRSNSLNLKQKKNFSIFIILFIFIDNINSIFDN